jgi:hypothetical protein
MRREVPTLGGYCADGRTRGGPGGHTARVPAPDLASTGDAEPSGRSRGSGDVDTPALSTRADVAGHDGRPGHGDPTGDSGVVFRVSHRRLFVSMLALAVVAWLVINALSALLAVVVGRADPELSLLPMVVSAVVYAVTFAAVFSLFIGRRVGWVRAGDRGLDMADTRRNPVFLPWSAVESVQLHWRGPATELIVTPTSIDAAVIDRVARWRPRVRNRRGRRVFVIDVGMMQPGPAAILDELNGRLAAHR